jgi:hypothetical protein
VRKSAVPTLAVSGRLGDLRGVGRLVRRWTDDSTAVWSSAPDTDRKKFGFWADTNGFIVAGDASTKNTMIWWK